MKNEFLMLIGLPGCGKSTWAKEQLKDLIFIPESGLYFGKYAVSSYECDTQAVIIGSDNLRELYGFAPGEGTSVVFNEMLALTKNYLKKGYTVIYDATNLSRKRRMSMLREVNGLCGKTKAILFTEPLKEVYRRNKLRDKKWVVPDAVINKMLRSFQVPFNEGFDTVVFVQTVPGDRLDFYMNEMLSFDQNNSHHALSLGEHSIKTYDYVSRNVHLMHLHQLKDAALYHDIGKLVTKDFHNAKGDPTEEAHYYGHENAGAYIYLSADTNTDPYNKLYTAALINWHMRPYTTMKVAKRQAEYNMLGPVFVEDLKLLHVADKLAH